METIKGKLTILINEDGTSIELLDEISHIRFAKVQVSPVEFQKALSRIAHVDCDIELRGVEFIGMKRESSNFMFAQPSWYDDKEDNYKQLAEYAQKILDKRGEGWIVQPYFGARDSFTFKNDGLIVVKANIYRFAQP